MNTPIPTSLALEDSGQLRITWQNGEVRYYPVRQLRDRCPCATCREKRQTPSVPGMLPVLRLEETLPLRIVCMKPVGNYAYGIAFSDGHDTGIYTLDSLWDWNSGSVQP